MAFRIPLPAADLSCTICCEIFKEPVVLKCSHSFCGPCLKRHWARQNQTRDCPLCRRPARGEPVPSLTIRNLCEALVQDEDDGSDDDDGDFDYRPREMCLIHRKELTLFCRVDQEPICVVCKTSKRHKRHECCPVKEAMADLKVKLEMERRSLCEKVAALDAAKSTHADTEEHIQVQARFVEKRMREEFSRLRRFLMAEEEARVAVLRKEVEQKTRAARAKVDDVNGRLKALGDAVRAVEEKMASTSVSVLKKGKGATPGADIQLDGRAAISGCLVDEAKYLGSLSFHVWEKMRDIVKKDGRQLQGKAEYDDYDEVDYLEDDDDEVLSFFVGL
ncbi:E3 ubiquitin-protein ligase TRIM35-like isoform X2 [Corythoichthys intestinalis]|uniref:E3 ubiquitin-protein ligase TRIM35-like isoform X2 n=1 Tax=Corythoichthys intestinalis TaxID=161448 RepID=UPI0025A4D838|nr:E3 ubiquitin-protein ligase TRIM35-like isoform X2 [Corythoichthys intestinalis]